MGLTVHNDLYFESEPNVRKNGHDIARLMEILKEGGHALVHAHGSWDHVLAWRAARLLPRHIPVVRTEHKGRTFHPVLHQLQFSSFMTDHLVVLSNHFRTEARNSLWRDPRTVYSVPGGVDCEEYAPMDPPPGKREEFGLSEDDIVMGIVARIQPHRRWGALLKAFDLIRRQNDRVKLVILGKSSHREELVDRPVEQMGLQDTVKPLGYRREDYRETLALLDGGMLLVPGSDGSCRAAMEMAAMGKPLVVSQRGVLPEIVGEREAGLSVPDTPEELAGAVLEMAGTRDGMRRWGQRARARMERTFSLAVQGDRMERVYAHIMQG
jgi:glycosyltransferase involved in cell wall biosynthesis